MITLYTITNKRAERMMANYYKSEHRNLSDVYKTFSTKKHAAWINCFNKMHYEGGHDFRIITANTFQFTCGWRNKFGNVRIETKDNSYLIIDLPF